MSSADDSTKQRVDAILLENVLRIPTTVLDRRVDVRWTTDAAYGSVSRISLIFEFPRNAPMTMDMELFNNSGRDPWLWIRYLYKSREFQLKHLSVHNGAEYAEVAKELEIPPPLDEAARMTEFCVALIAPLFEARVLAPYIASTETMERDGVPYYAGHGGMMRALFLPVFGAACLRIRGEE